MPELTVRIVAKPDKHVATLLTCLGLDLPKHNRILSTQPSAPSVLRQNVVQKNRPSQLSAPGKVPVLVIDGGTWVNAFPGAISGGAHVALGDNSRR